jgi:small-conductance mechanosensitive channel
MTDFKSFAPILEMFKPYAINLLLSIVIVFFVLSIRFVLLKSISNSKLNKEITWKKNSYYMTSLITIIMLFIVWLPHLTTFFTLFSILGTAFVIVLKDVLLNIAGWFYLIIRRPFEIGNRITIKEHSGDVIDIRLVEFSMIEVTSITEGGQSTGRIIRIPNSLVFLNPLINASKDFSLCWNEIKVNVTKKSNWQKAAKLLETLSHDHLEQIYKSDTRLKEAEKKYSIKYNKIEPKVYIDYDNDSIRLTLRHLSEPKKMRDINDQLWRVILEKFNKEKDIHLV